MKGVLVIVLAICCTLGRGQLATAEENVYETEDHVFYIEAMQKFNWSMALAECKRLNMPMVTLNTKEKVLRLHKVLKETYLDKRKPIPKLYIGANDLDEYRKHIWITNGEPITYANWEKHEPNNYGKLNERCVHLGFHGTDQWNDINCSRTYGFICELSKTDYEFAKMAKSMQFA